MKKVVCRVIGVVLFLAVGICILARVSEIFRTKTPKDRVHSLYALDRESIDVLVLGSSHGYSSIQPNVFWHDYGIPGFCMCSAEQSVPTSYYLLLEALRYQKPKVVLLESNYMYLEKKYSKQVRLHEALDGIRMGRIKFEALNDFLFSDETISFQDRLTYYLPFILYHSRWDELMPYDFHATELYLKGGIQNYEVMPIEDPGVPDAAVRIPEVPLTYFEKIRQTCEENGIELVVYAAPFGIEDGDVEKYRNWMGVNNSLETYLGEEGIPFLYYHKIPEAGIDFSVDFRNETHMNAYYDVRLKEYRLVSLRQYGGFLFVKGDISDKQFLFSLFEKHRFDMVVHFAAQAGVRYSLENPDAYIESNIIGFYNILEACRHYPVKHLVYASSSSVYAGNERVPFSTEDKADTPVSLYAATKRADELMAHCYSRLYEIPATGLRFFTVYGPAGRPDMAYFSFADKLARGETIRIFNYGNCRRDFTYIEDIVEGIERVMRRPPKKKTGADGLSAAPHALYNIGGGHPENLMDFVHILSEELILAGVLPQDFSVEQHMELVPMQAGDVPVTYADTSALERDFGFRPKVRLREGLKRFAQWYGEHRSCSPLRF